MSELIGPLTAQEWCSFRLRGDDDDLLQCCEVTSEIRDDVFYLLRMGGDRSGRDTMRHVWVLWLSHGFDETSQTHRLLDRMRAYYLGEDMEVADASR